MFSPTVRLAMRSDSRRIAPQLVLAAGLLSCGAIPALADTPAPIPAEPSASGAAPADEADRRRAVLESERWRRAMFELDEWLKVQQVYSPQRVRQIKADLAKRISEMSSYDLEYLLDNLDTKLRILEGPDATDARAWLGRYLSVMSDERRAALLKDAPDVTAMSESQLRDAIRQVEDKRAEVEKQAHTVRQARRTYGEFLETNREAIAAQRAQTRAQRDDVSFSPYRGPAVDSAPFADSFNSPTVVGVGPWTTFMGTGISSF